MTPRVLVTGATGFAGSHMAARLVADGYSVRVLVRATSDLRWVPAGVERVTADLRDADSLRALVTGVSWVFHFGGVTRVSRREEFFRVNAIGTQQLWDALREHAPELELFLYVSSLAASGPAPALESPRRDDDEPQPISAYGRSKLAAERWLQEHPRPGVRQLIVRPPAVYGPRDASILILFRWARRGLLPLPAPRGSRMSLIHARDLAAACLALAANRAAGIFHVSDGEFHSWEEFGTAAAGVLGKPVRGVRVPSWLAVAAGEVGELAGRLSGRMPPVNRDKVRDLRQRFWICDIRRALAQGFAPRVSLTEGIRETIDWYRAERWW